MTWDDICYAWALLPIVVWLLIAYGNRRAYSIRLQRELDALRANKDTPND